MHLDDRSHPGRGSRRDPGLVTAVEDPGWLPAVKALPRHLIPFVDLWSMRGSRTRRRGLIAVRTTHLSMAASLA